MVKMWIIRRYRRLWVKFDSKAFDFDQACGILKDDSQKFVSVFLSKLKELGWVTAELNSEDSRKRVYRLKDIKEIKNEVIDSIFSNELVKEVG